MKNLQKIKTISLVAVGLSLCACTAETSVAQLAVSTDETVKIDATDKINPLDYLSDVKEGSEVSYAIEDGVMTITVSNGDKSEEYEIPVEVEEPSVSIDEDILIDKYVGYDIEDYIHEDEGVSHTTTFDEETGELSVTFTKGEWSTTLNSVVTVTDSTPEEVWPKVYTGVDLAGDSGQILTLYADGSCSWSDTSMGLGPDSGTWTYSDGAYYLNNCTSAYYTGTAVVTDYGLYETWLGTPAAYTQGGLTRYTAWTLIQG